MKKLLPSLLLITACGDIKAPSFSPQSSSSSEEQNTPQDPQPNTNPTYIPPDGKPQAQPSVTPPAPTVTSLAISTVSDAPTCDEPMLGTLIYVMDDAQFKTCADDGWRDVTMPKQPGTIKGEFECKGKIGNDSYELRVTYITKTDAIYYFDVNEIVAAQGVRNQMITSWGSNAAPTLSGTVKEAEADNNPAWPRYVWSYEIGAAYPAIKKVSRDYNNVGAYVGENTVIYSIPASDCHKTDY